MANQEMDGGFGQFVKPAKGATVPQKGGKKIKK
jgi:hypothetical protein